MLRAAIALFVLAILFAFFGFTDVAGGVASVARIGFYTLSALAVVAVAGGALLPKRRGGEA
jgi:uncharacterized membrane protein YtjA (UPF0391 family)